jgi:hypothetical protein
MHITVQVRQGTAPALHRKTKSAATKKKASPREPQSADAIELLRAADELGVKLEPMHTGTRDPQLQTFFTVEVPDSQAAEHVINRLQQCSAIEAAYLKPMDELP